MEKKYVNLIFQGGGVKGLSYAGAFSTLPKDVKLKVVGGASAGAIAAALIAKGFTAEQLRAKLDALDLETLLEPKALEKVEEIKDFFAEVRALIAGGGGAWAAWQLYRKSKGLVQEHYENLTRNWGLFISDGLRDWLKPEFDDLRFENIPDFRAVEDLRIVASSLTHREISMFNKTDSAGERVIDAIVASASIPFFFRPAPLRGVTVDGGLLSNFPVRLVQREPYPTVGFRLSPLTVPSSQINTFAQFLRGLVETMVDAHDKVQPRPKIYCEKVIYFPSDITAIDFNLTQEQKNILFAMGQNAGNDVDWDVYSSSEPQRRGLDPDPDKVVTRVLENSERLYKVYSARERWPEALEDRAKYHVRIEEDGTAHYAETRIFRVSGKTPWFGSRAVLEFNSVDSVSKVSIADLQWRVDEIVDGETIEVPRFPIINETLKKGFVYSFLPPIMPGQPERTFSNSWVMPREYARTLCRSNSDSFGYATVQRAEKHLVWLEVELLISSQLNIDVQGPNGMQIVRDPVEKAINGRAYRRYTCSIEGKEVNVRTDFDFHLSVSRVANPRF